MRREGWVLMLVGSLLTAGSPGAGEPYAPQVGQPHPNFVLPRLDNRKPVSLSEFRGRKVLLIQFASW